MKEDIINKIISTCPMISEDQVLKRLEKEKRKTGGLISDETLLRMIAAEFGCEPAQDNMEMPAPMIKDLVPGLSDVTIIGRVLAIFPPKDFATTRKGKLASLLIADRSGLLRIVLWNDKTTLVENGKVKVGQVTRFSHGYTREDPGGKVELNLGEKGEVEANLADVKEKEYPNVFGFLTRISNLDSNLRNRRINTFGTVKKVFPPTIFNRENSTQGKVMRFILKDLTGEIPVVIWNEKVDELEKHLRVGDKLQVINGKVKKALTEGFEINVDASSFVGALTETEEVDNICDLNEGMEEVNVKGEVMTKPVLREVRTAKEEQLKVATFEIKDDTGTVWVSAWREQAETSAKLKPGDTILVKSAYVRRGFANQLEVTTRNMTSIVIKQ